MAACEHEAYVNRRSALSPSWATNRRWKSSDCFFNIFAPMNTSDAGLFAETRPSFEGRAGCDVPFDGSIARWRAFADARSSRLPAAVQRRCEPSRGPMRVVYSLNHEVDLKPGDLRRRLVEHALDPEAITAGLGAGWDTNRISLRATGLRTTRASRLSCPATVAGGSLLDRPGRRGG